MTYVSFWCCCACGRVSVICASLDGKPFALGKLGICRRCCREMLDAMTAEPALDPLEFSGGKTE